MARLCIPGFPFSKDRAAARFKTQPAFRSFPRRVSYRANPVFPCPSLLPVSPPRAGVRSFAETRKGSRLPIRSPSPSPSAVPRPLPRPVARAAPRAAPRPRPIPTPRHSLTPPGPVQTGNISRLEERRIARQARLRPWAQTRSPSANPSRQGPLSSVQRSQSSQPKILAPHTARAQRAIARIDDVLAKPMTLGVNGRKDESVRKCVRFGEVTVTSVSRWIVRQEHVFPAPLAALGHLQGWKVTPLTEPDEDGEEEKYTTYWGSDSYIMLTSNHSEGPCDRADCAWNSLARIQARRPAWTPPMVFKAWLMKRAMTRQRGGFAL